MAKNPYQKLKLLYLSKIMLEKTDDKHSLTVPEIIVELAKYGIVAERKSIYDDIKALNTYGIDIDCIKTKTYDYYVANRDFQLAELKLLVDAVQSSKFITYKKSVSLIKKIESFSSVYEAQQLQRQVYVTNRIKTMNESIYYNVDKIHNAIAENKQISFKYLEWTITNSRNNTEMLAATKQFRKNGGEYIISPWALTWDDENYYAVAYYEKYGGICNFRVDKMEHIEILDDDRIGQEHFKKFDMGNYSKKLFGMFGGTEKIVELQFANHLIGVVVDRFGKELLIKKIDDGHFTVKVNVVISPTFLAWVFAFGEEVKILSPESVIDEFKAKAKSILAQY